MKAPVLCIISLAALLSGCVNLKPKADHTQIFTLAADVPVAADLECQPMVYVTRVEMPGFLEDTRILYRLANGELESFAGARWTDALNVALPPCHRNAPPIYQPSQRPGLLSLVEHHTGGCQSRCPVRAFQRQRCGPGRGRSPMAD